MQINHPYQNLAQYKPTKASFHNHTFKNGVPTAAPWVALGIYRMCGIPILAITEHDRRLHPNRNIEEGNAPWTEEHWQHNYDDALLLKGFEASFPEDHVNVLGFLPEDAAAWTENPQSIPSTKIRDIFLSEGQSLLEAVNRHGGMTVLNHPGKWNNQSEHMTEDPELSRCQGIEIYNGGRARNTDTAAKPAVATPLWDAVLTAGFRVWGLANPDCHRYDFSKPACPLNGWNVLWIKHLTPQDVLDALRSGRFYASSGLEFDSIQVLNDTIQVTATAAETISFIGKNGTELATLAGPTAVYRPQGNEGYVRIEAQRNKPPFTGSPLCQTAWSQPFWIET